MARASIDTRRLDGAKVSREIFPHAESARAFDGAIVARKESQARGIKLKKSLINSIKGV